MLERRKMGKEENQGKGEGEKERKDRRNPPLRPLWPSRIDLYSYKTQESMPPIPRFKNKSTRLHHSACDKFVTAKVTSAKQGRYI
jgi:hypothetical protein